MNRTVASLALLKVTWSTEGRRDYISNFVPFIATLFNEKRYKKVKINTIRKDFTERYGLSIPYHPMVAILEQTRKAGYLTKNHKGAFVPVIDKIAEADFSDIAHEQERQYTIVINRFMSFCKDVYSEIVNLNEAEKIFVAYLKDHDLDLFFMNESLKSILPSVVEATVSQKYLMHRFVFHVYESEPEIFQFILDYSIGHIFANALISQQDALDIGGGDLANCRIYLDIAFLFNVTGTNGDERRDAYVEFLEALRLQKAELYIFSHTYEEFRGIVEGALPWIDNKSYDPVKASRVTEYFIEESYSSSDVEEFILQIDTKLQQLGIVLVESPDPQTDTFYQIGENALTDLIVEIYKERNSRFDEIDKEYTIQKDVKSIASVYKLRKGARPTKVRDLTYVFVTTNSAIALASKRFEKNERTERYLYIPTTVTDVFLGTLIWLSSPKIVTSINEKRLVAACSASLRPSKALARKLTDTVNKLLSRGEISPSDVTLLSQSRLARNMLQEETLSDPERFTDKTALDILEELRRTIRKEESEAFAVDRTEFESKTHDLEVAVESQSAQIAYFDTHVVSKLTKSCPLRSS